MTKTTARRLGRKLLPVLALLAVSCSEADLMTLSTNVPSFETGFDSGSPEGGLLSLFQMIGTIVLIVGSRLGFGV